MVRRSVPIGRRLRANAGKIVNAAIWSGAAFTCLVLYMVRAPDSGSRAVAVVRQHPVLAPASGRLVSVSVVSGQRVAAGEQLAVVEVPGLQQQLAAAQAELVAIQNEAGTAVADAERQFAKDADAAHARWLAARVALASDRAALVGVNLELGRLETPGTAVAALEVDAKRAERDALQAGVDAREDEYVVLERAWNDARGRAGILPNSPVESRVAAASAQVEAISALAEACVLRAQVSGTVTGISPDTKAASTFVGVPASGTWVQAGVPAFSLTEATSQEAVVYVSALMARQLAEGAPLALVVAGGERIDARVAAIGPALEVVPLRQQRDITVPEWGVPITLQAIDAVLTPGETLTVEF